MYDQGVDLWACGCIFGELLAWGPIFNGQSDIDQISAVQNILGTPTTNIWPVNEMVFSTNYHPFNEYNCIKEIESLPDYHKISFPTTEAVPLNTVIPCASTDALELLEKFLVYPSKMRIQASEV